MKQVKKAIDAHGRRLGGETPLLGTPLVARTRDRVLAEATRVLALKPGHPQALEAIKRLSTP